MNIVLARIDDRLIHGQVRGVETADINVEPAVIVHVRKGRTLFPRARRTGDAGPLSDILETEAAEIAKQMVRACFAHHKNIRPAVTIEIADRDACADRTGVEFVVKLPPHRRIVVRIAGLQAGLC